MNERITVTCSEDVRGLQVVLMKYVEGHGDPNYLFPVPLSFIILFVRGKTDQLAEHSWHWR
jgi:hypothetical protein